MKETKHQRTWKGLSGGQWVKMIQVLRTQAGLWELWIDDHYLVQQLPNGRLLVNCDNDFISLPLGPRAKQELERKIALAEHWNKQDGNC